MWVHHDPRAIMGCREVPWPCWARRTKSSKAHVAREGKKGRSPTRIGLDLESKSSPPQLRPRAWRGCFPRPSPIYRGEGAHQEDTPRPWCPSLSRYSVVPPPHPGNALRSAAGAPPPPSSPRRHVGCNPIYFSSPAYWIKKEEMSSS